MTGTILPREATVQSILKITLPDNVAINSNDEMLKDNHDRLILQAHNYERDDDVPIHFQIILILFYLKNC